MILLSKVACSWDGSLLTIGFAPPWSGAGAALPSPQVLRPDHRRRGGSRCPLQTVAVLNMAREDLWQNHPSQGSELPA